MRWMISDDMTQKIAKALRSVRMHKAVTEGLKGLDFDVVNLVKEDKDPNEVGEVDWCSGFKIDWKNDTAPSTVVFAIENFYNFMIKEWGRRDWLLEEENGGKNIEWCVWYNGKYRGASRGYKAVTDMIKEELTKPNLKQYYEYEVTESPFVIFIVPKVATDSL